MSDFFKESDCDVPREVVKIDGRFEFSKPLISLAKANRMFSEWLAKGKVVYGHKTSDTGLFQFYEQPATKDTHRALLVNSEELELDSAESLLKEAIANWENEWLAKPDRKWYDRARKLLERGGK